MEKQWKILPNESCPNCGDNLEVFSENPEKYDTEFITMLTDGEDVRCAAFCGFKSALSVDPETCEAWVQDGNLDELDVTD